MTKELKTIHVEYWENRPDNFTGLAIDITGDKAYYQNGKHHRTNGPAVECVNGHKEWYQNGKWHRLDGPAIEFADGSKEYYQKSKLHRLNGPAIEYADGSKYWYQNGKRHRIDGPAVEWADGTKYWHILDQELTEKQHNLFRKLWDQTTVDKTEKNMFAYTKLVTMEE